MIETRIEYNTGELPMANLAEVPEASGIGLHQRSADELVHLIRKLRWMGMADEADVMQTQLAAFRVSPGDSVIGDPRDTD
jgi:hypothetical protein